MIIKNYQEISENTIYEKKYDIIYSEEFESTCIGNFLLSRTDDLSDYSIWVSIGYFKLDNEYPSNYSLQDFTVEHGRKYKYSL